MTDNGIRPGYSGRSDDPEIIKGIGKFYWTVRVIFLVAIAAPPLVCAFIKGGKSMAIGAGLSAIFLAAYIIWELKRRLQKPWEGVIAEKFTKARNYFSVTSSIASYSRSVKYYIKVKTEGGTVKKKRISPAVFYEYLEVGDRVRFHPKLNGFYEKYDKSHDEYLICPACLGKSAPESDRCEYCGVPLMK